MSIRAQVLLLVLVCLGGSPRESIGQARLEEAPVWPGLRWDAYRSKRITRHFAVYSDLKEKDLDYYEAVFEGFSEFFERQYFRVPATKLLTMYLFSGLGSYGRYVKETTKIGTSYGYYLPEANLITINLESGLGTATHELVHHFVRTAMRRPVSSFVNEGFAAFFEKFIGHLDEKNRLHLTVGYFSNWRFPMTKKRIGQFTLEALMKSGNVDQSAARSFMLFLHKKGKLAEFITAYRSAPDDVAGIETLEQVMKQPLGRVEAEWKRWVREQPLDANVFLVERAFVLPHGDWERWLRMHEKTIRWNEEKGIYEATRRK